MKLYHASYVPTLHKDGLKPNQSPVCCNRSVDCVYLGSNDYLDSQYFEYCPKGIYYVFEVDVPQDNLEYLPKVNHYRYWGNIDPKYVKPFRVKVVK